MSTKDQVEKQLRTFGANLRRVRTAKSITQERLAEMADLNVRTVQKIEAGQTNILVTTLKRLCDGLECGSDDLLSRM